VAVVVQAEQVEMELLQKQVVEVQVELVHHHL
jgi:hypothetical protein